MCWICNGNDCSCCVYLKSAQQPEVELPEWYRSRFNAAFYMPATAHLTKLWFLDKGCFGKHVDRERTSEPRSRVGISITSGLWDRTKKRAISARALVRGQSLAQRYEIPEAVVRVIRFRKTLDIFGTCPWANIKFDENERILRMMTASHLRLIVGKREWSEHKSKLYPLIDSTTDLSPLENVVWVTNRQQGKTTNLAKFIAALSLLSPVGGNLMYIYSTGLDRSQELCRDAKKYITWIQGDASVQERLGRLGIAVPRIETNNERMYTIECGIAPGIINTVKARPKNADGCRGDAPQAAVFDEVGFISAQFWYLFAFPLLQVGGRIFTMATTPPPANSYFDIFAASIKKRNAENDRLFLLINHSMVCEKCIENDNAGKCTHKLFLVPRWKTVSKFVAMRALVPAKQRSAFEAEIFGVMDQDSPTYFPRKLLDYVFFEKQVVRSPRFGRNPVIYISVDPASHEVSFMGMSAAAYTTDGQVVILGAAEVSMHKCQIIQVTMCVTRFVESVLRSVLLRQYTAADIRIVPIVECNNNEILSKDIVSAISTVAKSRGVRFAMPFLRQYFTTAITENIGIWATHTTKASGVQLLYFMMMDNRLNFAEPFVTIGDVHKKQAATPSTVDIKKMLLEELANFHDDGTNITGKTADTNDDVAMTVVHFAHWSMSIRATAMLESMALMES